MKLVRKPIKNAHSCIKPGSQITLVLHNVRSLLDSLAITPGLSLGIKGANDLPPNLPHKPKTLTKKPKTSTSYIDQYIVSDNRSNHYDDQSKKDAEY